MHGRHERGVSLKNIKNGKKKNSLNICAECSHQHRDHDFSQWMPHGETIATHHLKRVNNINTIVFELIDYATLFFFN